MRSGRWILAICGLVGLASNVCIAQDRFTGYRDSDYRDSAFEETPRQRTIQYFSRTGGSASGPTDALPGDPRVQNPFTSDPQAAPRRNSQVPATRNEARNPFGEPRPRNRASTSQASESPFAGGSNIQQTGFDRPRSKRSTQFEVESPFAVSGDDSGVIHAEHERSQQQRRDSQIQQTRAIEETASDDDEDFSFDFDLDDFDAEFDDDEEPTFREPPRHQPRPRQQRPLRRPAASSAYGDRPALTEDQIAAIPQGKKSARVTAEWAKRGRVTVGQECQLELIVKNIGDAEATDVAVNSHFPTSVRLTDATPIPDDSRNFLTWNFASLKPGETKTIRITMIPSKRGDLATAAHVRFTEATAGAFTVEEPLLALNLKGPEQVTLGDAASQVLTVSNPGNGVAQNVVIEAIIPEGLEHPRGERLQMEIGSLNPGETRNIRLSLAAVSGGVKTLQIQAKADANLNESTTASVNVIAPSLQLDVEGPRLRYLGRNATYSLVLTNDGTGATSNVRVTHRLPEGFKFVHADKGGSLDNSTKSVNWFIGRLEPGASTELQVELEAVSLGQFVHAVRAVSEYGIATDASAETRIEGTSSLVLDVVDLDDPVEVGQETAYEVRVRNDGSKAAENVSLACELPEGVELVDIKGATPHTVDEGQILFRPIRELEPGKTALYRVHVRGTEAGNRRFRARVISDSVREPLVTEELTKFYAD